jgi:hypothetical protein
MDAAPGYGWSVVGKFVKPPGEGPVENAAADGEEEVNIECIELSWM